MSEDTRNKTYPAHIDGLTLGERLGEGGLGEAFSAEHRYGRVALKFMRPSLARDPAVVACFETEANRLLLLGGHPNIAPYITCGVLPREDGQEPLCWLATQFLYGVTLRQLIQKKGTHSIEVTLWLIENTCRGVQYAHEKGVLHRNLRPENVVFVMMEDGGPLEVKVLDFAIAKIRDEGVSAFTQTRDWKGGWQYMSPEQIAGGRVDERSDVYALGLIMYFLLAGKDAFEEGNPRSIYAQQRQGLPPAADLDINLQVMAEKAAAFRPEDRYQTVKEMLEAIERYSERTHDQSLSVSRRSGRNWIAAFVGLMVLTAFAWLASRDIQKETTTPPPRVVTRTSVVRVADAGIPRRGERDAGLVVVTPSRPTTAPAPSPRPPATIRRVPVRPRRSRPEDLSPFRPLSES